MIEEYKTRTKILVEAAREAGFSISNKIYEELTFGYPILIITFVNGVRVSHVNQPTLIVRVWYYDEVTQLIIDNFKRTFRLYIATLDNATLKIRETENYILQGLINGSIEVYTDEP